MAKMPKLVKYNGQKESYYPSSSASLLKEGKVYHVIHCDVHDWYTLYTLEGVKGTFNSVWFDTVEYTIPAYMAIASSVPEIGKRCLCNKITYENGILRVEPWKTSTVRAVNCLGGNVYNVTTLNSLYVVQVVG